MITNWFMVLYVWLNFYAFKLYAGVFILNTTHWIWIEDSDTRRTFIVRDIIEAVIREICF